jgi:NAD(P)-dependent dehydrogenase (short-subunit alcohol dehydrogenase family)
LKKPLNQQVVVITGASSGIGLTTARIAAERGATVVLVARNAEVLAREVSNIKGKGGRAIYVAADVGSKEGLQAAADRTVEAFGGFDTWVNVAGVTIYGNLWDVEENDSQRLMQTNFWGVVHGSLIAVKHLRDKGGALVNVGSVASDIAFPLQGMYCASKHAVKGFTEALRMELLENSIPIGVTLIKPTSIDSPIVHHARNYMEDEPSLPPPLYPPEEVAEAILYAAVHPRRDMYVGGPGKAISALKAIAPGQYESLAPAIASFERQSRRPRDPAGTLYHSKSKGETRGNNPGYVRGHSFYTRAGLHPFSATVLTTGFTAAAAAFLIAYRPGKRNGGN